MVLLYRTVRILVDFKLVAKLTKHIQVREGQRAKKYVKMTPKTLFMTLDSHKMTLRFLDPFLFWISRKSFGISRHSRIFRGSKTRFSTKVKRKNERSARIASLCAKLRNSLFLDIWIRQNLNYWNPKNAHAKCNVFFSIATCQFCKNHEIYPKNTFFETFQTNFSYHPLPFFAKILQDSELNFADFTMRTHGKIISSLSFSKSIWCKTVWNYWSQKIYFLRNEKLISFSSFCSCPCFLCMFLTVFLVEFATKVYYNLSTKWWKKSRKQKCRFFWIPKNFDLQISDFTTRLVGWNDVVTSLHVSIKKMWEVIGLQIKFKLS